MVFDDGGDHAGRPEQLPNGHAMVHGLAMSLNIERACQ